MAETNATHATTGHLLQDPKHTAGDLRMIRAAIRRGWDIPEQLLAGLPGELVKIIAKKSPATGNHAYDVRSRLRAIELIMKMAADNAAAEAKATEFGDADEPDGVTVADMLRMMDAQTAPAPGIQ